MLFYKVVYWAGMILEVVIRYPHEQVYKATPKTEKRVSLTEKVLPVLLTVGEGLFPLIYTFTNWLAFANYHLPLWLGWLGIILMACSLLIFWRGHRDLKANWSPTLEIRKEHTLVTDGIYRFMRHPMYASNWIWVIAQLLLLQNWLAGPIGLLFFIPFYLLRVKAEEKMMVDTFGSQYAEYMKKTGSVFPK